MAGISSAPVAKLTESMPEGCAQTCEPTLWRGNLMQLIGMGWRMQWEHSRLPASSVLNPHTFRLFCFFQRQWHLPGHLPTCYGVKFPPWPVSPFPPSPHRYDTSAPELALAPN